eukprot:TRINITY_DN54978_c0_g1_i1.p1 TRINITY_DN54978_c0_g1~~TRINITY_DN54978_c0_g1_i1.p1  ORF type:complete len:432 (+),score=40.65 TRINITY_DN54978_c0_g1_i1:113-1408(+)
MLPCTLGSRCGLCLGLLLWRLHICLSEKVKEARSDDNICDSSSVEDATCDSLDGSKSVEAKVADMSVREMRRLIMACGLDSNDCFEKTCLQARATQALTRQRTGNCLAQEWVEWSPRNSADASRLKNMASRDAASKKQRKTSGFDSSTASPKSSFAIELFPEDNSALAAASVNTLRQMIAHAGGSHHDCPERADLLQRAKEVLRKPKKFPKPAPFRRGGRVAHVLTPKNVLKREHLSLLIVLHGAGRTDKGIQHMVLQFSKVASRKRCLIVIPASLDKTWDTMQAMKRKDTSHDTLFLSQVLNRVRRDYLVDDKRIGLLGFSDGGSYALTLAANNPQIFQAAMPWSAGYYHHDVQLTRGVATRPQILHGHGQADELFDFQKVAVPMRQSLRNAGHKVTKFTRKTAGHGTPSEFNDKAIDWWLALPPHAGFI